MGFLNSKAQDGIAQEKRDVAGGRSAGGGKQNGRLGRSREEGEGGVGQRDQIHGELGHGLIERGPLEIAGVEGDVRIAIVARGFLAAGITRTRVGAGVLVGGRFLAMTGVREIALVAGAEAQNDLLHRDDHDEEES